MAISNGFYKYVNKWVIDEQSERVIYRPFEANTNPYQADLFIVGAHPTPLLSDEVTDAHRYANALVTQTEFEALFPNYQQTTSRDTKGAQKLAALLEESDIKSVISYVNALAADNLKSLKEQKQKTPQLYNRGIEIFKEVIEEIQPSYILLHGTYALQKFRTIYSGYFIEYGHDGRSTADLSDEGVFGKIVHDNGKETLVFACKSVSIKKEREEIFEHLIHQIKKTKTSKSYSN